MDVIRLSYSSLSDLNEANADSKAPEATKAIENSETNQYEEQEPGEILSDNEAKTDTADTADTSANLKDGNGKHQSQLQQTLRNNENSYANTTKPSTPFRKPYSYHQRSFPGNKKHRAVQLNPNTTKHEYIPLKTRTPLLSKHKQHGTETRKSYNGTETEENRRPTLKKIYGSIAGKRTEEHKSKEVDKQIGISLFIYLTRKNEHSSFNCLLS